MGRPAGEVMDSHSELRRRMAREAEAEALAFRSRRRCDIAHPQTHLAHIERMREEHRPLHGRCFGKAVSIIAFKLW
jgi:hypothetical protein